MQYARWGILNTMFYFLGVLLGGSWGWLLSRQCFYSWIVAYAGELMDVSSSCLRVLKSIGELKNHPRFYQVKQICVTFLNITYILHITFVLWCKAMYGDTVLPPNGAAALVLFLPSPSVLPLPPTSFFFGDGTQAFYAASLSCRPSFLQLQWLSSTLSRRKQSRGQDLFPGVSLQFPYCLTFKSSGSGLPPYPTLFFVSVFCWGARDGAQASCTLSTCSSLVAPWPPPLLSGHTGL